MSRYLDRVKATQTTPGTRSVRDYDWRAVFLEHLAETKNPALSAKLAGISLGTVRSVKFNEPDFSRAWDELLRWEADTLEVDAFRLAREKDTRLIPTLLKAHKPERYSETRKLEISGGKPIQVQIQAVHIDYRDAVAALAPPDPDSREEGQTPAQIIPTATVLDYAETEDADADPYEEDDE